MLAFAVALAEQPLLFEGELSLPRLAGEPASACSNRNGAPTWRVACVVVPAADADAAQQAYVDGLAPLGWTVARKAEFGYWLRRNTSDGVCANVMMSLAPVLVPKGAPPPKTRTLKFIHMGQISCPKPQDAS